MEADIMQNDETFDDCFFNWNEQNAFEIPSPPSGTDTDSDSGIGLSSNSNSPASNVNVHVNDFVLDLNQQAIPAIDDGFDFNSLTTDELLNNLDLIFKDEQLNQVQPADNCNTVIDDDIQLIEDIKSEPLDYSLNQNDNKSKRANKLVNTKEETIASLINQLKSCNQLQQQQGKKETIRIINDPQQLAQLLNTRPQLNKPQITTLKQINPSLQNQQPKIQILPATTNVQQLVSVLPSAIIATTVPSNSPPQQTPIIQISTNQSNSNSSAKIVSVQPINKLIAIAPQKNGQDGCSLTKKIKIESNATPGRSNVKPLAPKLKADVNSTLTSATIPTQSSINILIPPVNQHQLVTASPQASSIVYPTSESQQSPQTAFILTNESSKFSNDSSNSQDNDFTSSLSKKQFRMMKNRESACLSRKRKKEYMQNLEDKLKEIFLENQKLKSENGSLKEKINSLTIENNALKSNNPNTSFPQAKTAKNSLKRPYVMFAILFVMGLNIFHFGNLNGSQNAAFNSGNSLAILGPAQNNYNAFQSNKIENSDSNALSVLHVGRTLLSDDDYDQSDIDPNTSRKNTSQSVENDISNKELMNISNTANSSLEIVNINNTWHIVDPELCAKVAMFNHTHSIKINAELHGWYERHNKAAKTNSVKKQSSPSAATATVNSNGSSNQIIDKISGAVEQKQAPKFRMRSIISNENKKAKKKASYEISLYNENEKVYDEFVRTIRRRNDTFYVVSFRRDHIMFPALNHNKTQKPRMSLVMPALFQINDKNNNTRNSIAFMQIDCEVLDTTLINLKSSDIPINFVKLLLEDYDLMQNAADSNKNSHN